jgi:hypothetical protein
MRLLALLTTLLLVASTAPAQQVPTRFDPTGPALAVSTAALVADILTTLYLRQTCYYCQETNPVARPFVHAGPVPTLLFGAAVAGGTIWATKKFRATPVGQHTWWLLPLAMSVASSYGTSQNLRWIRWWHGTSPSP